MAREERPDRVIAENPQPVASSAGVTPQKPMPNFGPGIRPYNQFDVLVDIDGGDIDFYFVVEVDDKQTLLNAGSGAFPFKTKLVRKLVQSGAWKVYTEGFKLGGNTVPAEVPAEEVKPPPPKKAPKNMRERQERPTKR